MKFDKVVPIVEEFEPVLVRNFYTEYSLQVGFKAFTIDIRFLVANDSKSILKIYYNKKIYDITNKKTDADFVRGYFKFLIDNAYWSYVKTSEVEFECISFNEYIEKYIHKNDVMNNFKEKQKHVREKERKRQEKINERKIRKRVERENIAKLTNVLYG